MLRNTLVLVAIVLMVTACDGRPTPTAPSGGTLSDPPQSSEVSKGDQSSASNLQEVIPSQEVTIEDLGEFDFARSHRYEGDAYRKERVSQDSTRYRRLLFTNHTSAFQGVRAYWRCRDSDGVLMLDKDMAAILPPDRSLVFLLGASNLNYKCEPVIDHVDNWNSYVESVKVVKSELKEDVLEFILENPGPISIDGHHWARIVAQGFDKDGNVVLSETGDTLIIIPAGERARMSIRLRQLDLGSSVADTTQPEVVRYEVIPIVLNQKNIGP